MNEVAKARQAGVATVHSLDLRGHGGSGSGNGRISRIGQPDDDLDDFIKGVTFGKSGIRWTMVGFPIGGGFVPLGKRPERQPVRFLRRDLSPYF